MHRFGDTAVYLSKNRQNRQFVPTRLRNRPRSGGPLSNIVMSQIFLETRMFWLSDGGEIMTLAFFVLIQYRSVTDGRTDRQTDILPLAIPAVCIARYANALVINRSRRLPSTARSIATADAALSDSRIAEHGATMQRNSVKRLGSKSLLLLLIA